MAEAHGSPEEPTRRFEVALANGRTLTCPAYPAACDWVAVSEGGVEIYRVSAGEVAADPCAQLTRLADALIPGRPENPTLPQPADQDTADWCECAVAAIDGGRTIRFAPAPEQTDSVRVCDTAGEELGYWVSTEFEQDASDCLGAAVGALAGGEVI
jgi:hypothetical protein